MFFIDFTEYVFLSAIRHTTSTGGDYPASLTLPTEPIPTMNP